MLSGSIRKVVSAAILLLCLSTFGFAQAWVSPKGTGSFGISYQNVSVTTHYFAHGETFRIIGGEKLYLNGGVRFQTTFLDASYSLTDKLGISATLPFVEVKYTEDHGQPGSTFGNAHVIIIDPTKDPNLPSNQMITLDDGKYHGGFQDISLRLRYNVASNPVYFTPFIEYSAPTHAYPFYSHAVIGSRIAEFQIGSYLGLNSLSFLPDAYVQFRYSFGFVQRIIGISRTRHHAEAEFGYFITPRIRGFGVLIGQYTNGGVELPTSFPTKAERNSLNPLFFHHIQASRDNIFDVGTGLQYAMNDRMDLYGALTHSIAGRNVHAINYGITFGISWGFSGSPQRPCHC